MQERDNMKISICLEEETVILGGMLLQYRLKCNENPAECYYVHVKYGTEEAEAIIGANLGLALDGFRLLVCGRVTPCTLLDVIRDWEIEERIF